ncbi:unnamed protein product [Adineta ricciae]|uniref:Uncharacterized protein n=1 Tax=Adineta ricciae TaxID=249248 RepID=A0A814TMV5_ADIRI|nr:unnamed protein product [Adineta ricciae]
MASINTIDLDRCEQALSTLVPNNNSNNDVSTRRYQPRTLNEHNQFRTIFLPFYPKLDCYMPDWLLLASVPQSQLSTQETARRQHGAYTADALMMMNKYRYSNYELLHLSEQDAIELATRLNVGQSIITFNATRMRGISMQLFELHGSFRRRILRTQHEPLRGLVLTSNETAIALEFFLQIDVDVFYMKTCAYRGADPSQFHIRGLFFENNDEPQARYQMKPCNSDSCQFCHPRENQLEGQTWVPIDFNTTSMHQFLNGYTTYLNCPATCTTTNIIYSMTCPCGEYDYIDSTKDTLAHALSYHQQHINRIMHEKLTGNSLYPGIPPPESLAQEYERADKMRLYQHAARCPIALRLFLRQNPCYWCFVPQIWRDAQVDNMDYLQGSNAAGFHTIDLQSLRIIAMVTSTNRRLAMCIDRVPWTPAAYAFSYLQRKQQRAFFEHLLTLPIDELPYSPVDIYKIAIIAVLPENCSKLLRYLIETFFITHCETKLNMICPSGGDPERRFGRAYDLVWCYNLNRPFAAIPQPPGNH